MLCVTQNKSLYVFCRKPRTDMLISANSHVNRESPLHGSQSDILCVCVRPSISLHAVCPPGSPLGPGSRHPHVAGPHGDLAGGCHHNLEASPERSRGAHDGLETVTGAQAHCNKGRGSKRPRGVYDLLWAQCSTQMDRLLFQRKKGKNKLRCLVLS